MELTTTQAHTGEGVKNIKKAVLIMAAALLEYSLLMF